MSEGREKGDDHGGRYEKWAQCGSCNVGMQLSCTVYFQIRQEKVLWNSSGDVLGVYVMVCADIRPSSYTGVNISKGDSREPQKIQ